MTRWRALAVTSTLLLLAGCIRHLYAPPETAIAGMGAGTKVFTLTNLRAKGQSVSAANFQFPELIPVCSEVTLVSATDASLRFKVPTRGKEYFFEDHKVAGEPFEQVLARYFGRACPDAALAALSPDEREAVKLGVVKPGMSHEAVILALGYPPLASTRTLELPTWRYWTTSMQSFIVVFDDDGKVEGVRY